MRSSGFDADTPEPGEEAHVVSVPHMQSEPSILSGDEGFYYYLPGANRSQLIQALEDVGFEFGRLTDVIDAANASKGNGESESGT